MLLRFLTQIRRYWEQFTQGPSPVVKDWVRAAVLSKAGRYSEALSLYDSALQKLSEPNARLSVLLEAFFCSFRLKRFSQAEQYLRIAIVEHPENQESYVRLARLHMWLGYSLEAAWCMRDCLRRVPADPELVTQFVTAVVESGGMSYLAQEAEALLSTFHFEPEAFPRLEVARLRLELLRNESPSARLALARYAAMDKGPFEAVVAFAQILLAEGKVAYARHQLHRALAVSPEHPRVLRLLAATYLTSGSFFEPEFAAQIATSACQVTAWSGVQEMHTLAQAHVLCGDKISALLVASRAKDAGLKLLGSYPHAQKLDKLIQQLSSGTSA